MLKNTDRLRREESIVFYWFSLHTYICECTYICMLVRILYINKMSWVLNCIDTVQQPSILISRVCKNLILISSELQDSKKIRSFWTYCIHRLLFAHVFPKWLLYLHFKDPFWISVLVYKRVDELWQFFIHIILYMYMYIGSNMLLQTHSNIDSCQNLCMYSMYIVHVCMVCFIQCTFVENMHNMWLVMTLAREKVSLSIY